MHTQTFNTTTLCQRCTTGAAGEHGHEALDFYVGGPYPGQNIFKCMDCNDRWIRHYSETTRFGWTRFELHAAQQRQACYYSSRRIVKQ